MPIERIMALDVGERRIGVAVSDPLGITVRPVGTVEISADKSVSGIAAAITAVVAYVRQLEPRRLVVGDPRLPSGDRGPRADMVDAFVADLTIGLTAEGSLGPLPIERWDESYTTETALARLRSRGVKVGTAKERTRAGIDAEAAAVILEEWLRAHA
jgi:putative Holliday junction resolvase